MAIKLVGAEFATICCAVVIDFVLHMKTTFKIIKDGRKLTGTEIETVRHLMAKKDFRKKMKIYSVYLLWLLGTLYLKEFLAYLFIFPPGGFQFLVPFIITVCRELDERIRSKIVSKMMGVKDEVATVLVTVVVICGYAPFMAIKLVGAEFATICCAVAIDFVLHMKTTFKIIKDGRNVRGTEIEIERTESKTKLSTLITAELIEGFTPLIYAICILLAYHGPNAHLFAGIGKSHWGVAIEDLGPLYQTMSILFGVDLFTVLISSFCLWKVAHLNVLSEFYRVLTKYWYILAIYLSLIFSSAFCTIDINLGLDPTGSNQWISKEGWINLVNASIALTNEEKVELMGKFNIE